MSQSQADAIWNRAALEEGGAQPRAGDLALAALLRAHGYIMNGGVHHAIECLSREDHAAAVSGYLYFGLSAAAEVLSSAAGGPLNESEDAANDAYWRQVPDDESLARAFEIVLRERIDEFAGIGES